MFCQRIRTLSPFSLTYAYLDIPKYLADQIFIKNKIKVKFKEEFVKADTLSLYVRLIKMILESLKHRFAN